jgi:hypothetical protein
VSVRASSSASANCLAVANRSAGVRASALLTTWSSAADTVSRTVRIGGTVSVIIRAVIAAALAPVNGGAPASIS